LLLGLSLGAKKRGPNGAEKVGDQLAGEEPVWDRKWREKAASLEEEAPLFSFLEWAKRMKKEGPL